VNDAIDDPAEPEYHHSFSLDFGTQPARNGYGRQVIRALSAESNMSERLDGGVVR